MMRRLKQFAPVIATLALLVYVGAVERLSIVTMGVDAFQERSRAAVDRLPARVGPWKLEKEEQLDQRAKDLLDANAARSIIFRNTVTGAYASFSVAQVKDARNMTGHAPSNCYRGNGFTLAAPETRKLKIGEFDIEAGVYRMWRDLPTGRSERWTVYSFFIFPDGTFGHTLRDLDVLAANYRKLKYGDAHVQVVTYDPRLTDQQRDEIFTALVGSPQSLQMIRTMRTGLDWFGRRLLADSLDSLSVLRKGIKQ